jgi:transglutaminase-like putative cysteine protease
MKETLTFQQVQRSVRFGAFVLVAASALSLALTQRMAGSALVLTAAMVIAWFKAPSSQRSTLWEIASFAYLIFFFFDLLKISQALAPSLVHLFIFILINKMFNLYSIRDYYQLYLLTFLTVLAASSLSVEIEMFYMIVAYILMLIWNIVSLTLFREWQQDSSQKFPFSLFGGWYVLSMMVAGMVTFGIALAIFFILPRMQLGYLGEFTSGKAQHVSGFSQKVSLGDIASIQENTDVAMRVKVTPVNTDPNYRYYWRGISYDHYDGKTWSTGYPGNRFLRKYSEGVFHASGYAANDPQLVHQEFYLEPLDTRVIFGLDRVMKLKGNFGEVSRDTNSSLMAMGRTQSYEVFSRLNRPTIESLQSAGKQSLPETISRYQLQLPFHSDKIEELARSITNDETTQLRKVIAVKRYLEKNYEYSLTDITQDRKDPVSRFLFEKKSGHCEYFATSMVILLRHIGIPARIVHGFLEGEFNELGGFYVVRNSDAHSWVEVYFDGTWVSFDPSPRPELLAADSSFWQLDFYKIMDSINFFWDRYILIYSGQDQLDAFTAVRDRYREFKSQVRDKDYPETILERLNTWWRTNREIIAIIFIALTAIAVALRIVLRRRRARKISQSPVLFYQEMLSILERRGFNREPNSTPAEFMQSIQATIPQDVQKDLDRITSLFYQTRFGNYQLTEIDQIHVRISLDRLRNMQQ